MRGLVSLLVMMHLHNTFADEPVRCRAITFGSPALERIDARTRLAWIQARLGRASRRAKIWQLTWLSIYAAATAGNTAGLATSNNQVDYIDWGLGVGSSLAYLVATAIPPRVIRDGRRVHDAPAQYDPCIALADAERLFERDARDVAFRRGFVAHAGNFIFNIGLSVALAALGHFGEVLLHGLVELAVGEIQIATTPRDVIEDLVRYRLGRLDGAAPALEPVWRVAPFAVGDRYGVSLRVDY